jgi:hypothetical protein
MGLKLRNLYGAIGVKACFGTSYLPV